MESLEVVDSHSWVDLRIKEEFTELTKEEMMLLEREVLHNEQLRRNSELPANSSKNRYTLFRPYDETRVILESLERVENSDYINASFVNGEVSGSYHNYIACQAPLEETITDFWRMIWEQRCSVVIMLTDFEIRNSKAVQYWPDEGEVKRCGKLLICHKKNFMLGEIEVRSLLVRDATNQAIPTREVIHLQYRKWPDFGVPSTTKTTRDLLVLVNRFKERATRIYSLDGPIVVHCSAGVGRTGVFIACHITLEKLMRSEQPNIKQTVRKIRAQRQGMVRTEEQYFLIYNVLIDAIKSNLIPDWRNVRPNLSRTESLVVEVK